MSPFLKTIPCLKNPLSLEKTQLTKGFQKIPLMGLKGVLKS